MALLSQVSRFAWSVGTLMGDVPQPAVGSRVGPFTRRRHDGGCGVGVGGGGVVRMRDAAAGVACSIACGFGSGARCQAEM